MRFLTSLVLVSSLALWVQPSRAQTLFHDATVEVGLGGYQAGTGDGHAPGAVFADLDDDGYPDLYLVRGAGAANLLYRNVPDGGGGRAFSQVAGNGGAGDTGAATGAIAGDYDNDGDLDLFVINFDQPNALFRSQWVETGALTFVDVTGQTDPTPGVADDQHGVGIAYHEGVALDNSLTAAWGDADRDGDLDLFVGNHNGYLGSPIEGPPPSVGRRDVFYVNNGDGTFSDRTMDYDVPGYQWANGAYQTQYQKFSSSNAVIFADLDNDRWPDLFVTNKVGGPTDRDMLYMNRGVDGEGTWLGYEQVTYTLSPTFGHMTGGAMGVDVADPDHDGDLDIYITDWSDLDNAGPGLNDYWVNQLTETGQLGFVHSSDLAAAYSWGSVFQDLDNDGHEDLHVAVQGPERDFLYRNLGGGTFVEEATAAGVASTLNARGDVSADYDRDGWPDLFVVRPWGPPSALWENRSDQLAPGRRFLVVKLIGDASEPGPFLSTRDAIGARVRVHADLDANGSVEPDEIQIREVVSGHSNAASTSSLEIELGLGLAGSATLEVMWPSGRDSIYTRAADQHVTIDEATRPEAVADLRVDDGTLSWQPVGDATGYDVVVGDLGSLRSTGGAFDVAATGCLVSNHPSAVLADATAPAPGDGTWILVRSVNGHVGTWDSGNSGGGSQAEPRDAELPDCP